MVGGDASTKSNRRGRIVGSAQTKIGQLAMDALGYSMAPPHTSPIHGKVIYGTN